MRSRLPLALLVLLVAATSAARPIRFASPQTFPSGIAHTSRVAVADFNGDGYPDFAISSTYNWVAVFLNNGDGTFSAPTIYTLSYYVTGQVAVGDFNNDGHLDMAVVGGDEAGNGLAFFAGKGDGTFQPVRYFPTTLARSEITAVAADFNRDGNLDVFTGANCGGELIVGDGKGNFSDGALVNACGEGLSVADFNGDGYPDAALATAFGQEGVNIVLGNGDGTFQSPLFYSETGEPGAMATGDFNSDKKLDLAVTVFQGSTILVLEGNGDGTFTNGGEWYAGPSPSSVAVADFNADGKLDLAVANFGGIGVSILPGKGDGTFSKHSSLSTAPSPSDVAAIDLNGDGSPDLVVVNNGNDSVSVLLNAEGTFIQLTSSQNPSHVGQAVTFTATVQGSVNKSSVPTGKITFKDGTKPLGHIALGQGQASFTTSALKAGNHNITASYNGDAKFNKNDSPVLVQTVQ